MSGYNVNTGYITVGIEPIHVTVKPEVLIRIHVCNTDSGTQTWNLYHSPADEDRSDEHFLYKGLSAAANRVTDYNIVQFLQPGDTIYASASAEGKIVLQMSVVDYADWVSSK